MVCNSKTQLEENYAKDTHREKNPKLFRRFQKRRLYSVTFILENHKLPNLQGHPTQSGLFENDIR